MNKLLKAAISPLAAVMDSGKNAGFAMGLIPGVARRQSADDMTDEERQAAMAAAQGGMGMKKGGKVSSASKRADGIAKKGKTRGKMV